MYKNNPITAFISNRVMFKAFWTLLVVFSNCGRAVWNKDRREAPSAARVSGLNGAGQ